MRRQVSRWASCRWSEAPLPLGRAAGGRRAAAPAPGPLHAPPGAWAPGASSSSVSVSLGGEERQSGFGVLVT